MWYKILIFQPARRSYERQRRVQYYNSESEEEEEHIEETKNDPIITKDDKKCYKKANTTKTVKAPKVTKAKQRIAKEVWYSYKTQNIYIIFIFYLLCIVLQHFYDKSFLELGAFSVQTHRLPNLFTSRLSLTCCVSLLGNLCDYLENSPWHPAPLPHNQSMTCPCLPPWKNKHICWKPVLVFFCETTQ